jgi:hypothetical protein
MLAWIPMAAPKGQRHFTATEYLHRDAVERMDDAEPAEPEPESEEQ